MASTHSTKSPAFQFYAADFLHDDNVEEMSFTERGIYITLLCLDWLGHGLPADPDAIARRIRMPEHRFRRVWEARLCRCFVQKGDRLYNPRLLSERDKQSYFRDRQSGNGKLGGRPPKQPKPLSNETQAFSVSKPRVRDETEKRRDEIEIFKGGPGETAPPMDEWWIEFLRLYPEARRRNNAITNGLFVNALLSATDGPVKAWERMRANLSANVFSHEWAVKGMCPGMEKYLEQGRWENALPPSPPVAEQISAKTARMLGSV